MSAHKKAVNLVANRRLRKSVYLKKIGGWSIIAVGAFGAGLFSSIFPVLLALGGWAYIKYRLPDDDVLIEEEKKVLEALRFTANYNINVAKKRARGEEHVPMALYTMLESQMGQEFLYSVSDDELQWMKRMYDQMIQNYIDDEAKLETARENFYQLGRPKSRELEAYFKGKNEITQEDKDLAELEKLLEAEK